MKPENLLIDDKGNLKICDFGLSTVFRHAGKKRRLTTICGTKPYLAPEVLFGDYDGEAIDVWSCGVILFVVLVGNTPWDEPSDESPEFCEYFANEHFEETEPWNRLSTDVYNLIRNMCNAYEDQRYTIKKIKKNSWFKRQTHLHQMTAHRESAALDRLLSQMAVDDSQIFASQMDVMSQQYKSQQSYVSNMDMDFQPTQPPTMHIDIPKNNNISFSQPLEHIASPRGYETAINFSQPSTVSHSSVSRFYTRNTNILSKISSVLQDFLVTFNASQDSVQFSTVDRRKCPLSGEIHVQIAMDDLLMVHFRRIRGCPLEFKRFDGAMRDALDDYVCASGTN